MAAEFSRSAARLDAAGLFTAGMMNTVLASLDAVLVVGPGTKARESEILLRAEWIADHTLRWQGGWLFWVAVTLTFCWSYFAIGRNVRTAAPWVALAVGVALIAAAVDVVGVLVNLSVLPELAVALGDAVAAGDSTVSPVFAATENLTNALTNVGAFGLYTMAGLLLLPAVFATPDYPRWLAWLGVGEWGIAALATVLLIAAPELAMAPLLVSFALYAPWVWGSAVWLLRGRSLELPVIRARR